jgi:hypothetical protein
MVWKKLDRFRKFFQLRRRPFENTPLPYRPFLETLEDRIMLSAARPTSDRFQSTVPCGISLVGSTIADVYVPEGQQPPQGIPANPFAPFMPPGGLQPGTITILGQPIQVR